MEETLQEEKWESKESINDQLDAFVHFFEVPQYLYLFPTPDLVFPDLFRSDVVRFEMSKGKP